MRIFLFLSVCVSLVSFAVRAQKINEAYQLNLKPASSVIKVDGVVDEAAWMDADVASDFYMVLPMDTSKANVRTDVRMTYEQ
jgi:hypothetical protein